MHGLSRPFGPPESIHTSDARFCFFETMTRALRYVNLKRRRKVGAMRHKQLCRWRREGALALQTHDVRSASRKPILNVADATHSPTRDQPRRWPLLATRASMRSGSSRHGPSTLYSRLTVAAILFKRAANCSGVSVHGSLGSVRRSRNLIHDTAVSCNMISCNAPGC